MTRLRSIAFFPFAIAFAYLVYVGNPLFVVPSDLVRPLVISFAIIALAMLLIVRRTTAVRAGLIVSGAMLILIPETSSIAGLVIIGIGVAILVALAIVHRPVRTDGRLLGVLNLAGLGLVAVSIVSYVLSGPAAMPPYAAKACPDGIHAGPNIYAILLDGYAREDTLKRVYDYDDEPFLGALEDQGFWVDRNSHTTYSFTEWVVPSVLNMQQVPKISRITSHNGNLERAIEDSIQHSEAADLLRCAGYETVATGEPYRYLEMATADRYLDHGRMNHLEIDLLQRTRLAILLDAVAPGFIDAQHRAQIEDALADTATVAAEPTTKPRFVWTHILAPHAPRVYDGDGPAPTHATPLGVSIGADTFEETNQTEQEFKDAYVGNLKGVGERALTTVDAIVKADPTAVVIVFSDHGSALNYSLDRDAAGTADYAERFGNLFAVRVPGGESLYTSPVTPLNILGPIFNRYLGTSIEKQPDQAFGGPENHDGRLRFVPIDPSTTAPPTPVP